jgi:lipopolysaccharide transport system ATP-binding protein
MPTVIKVENLSKAYQLGEIGTGTLSNDFQRFLARMRGKEDPFLTLGEINDRTVKSDNDVIWSLKDINFKVSQSDTVGIIGRNGAGKSTLLKLLSRVTAPTTGSVKMKGRIASLLEVGTGFHPDLSGRDNIYLNGAILGMRKAEITRKFDEIISFSGVERYIDTPVKRYSSGMYVRLAFSVAAHLESEILIVDEVLAVGDAEFQKKCLGKMNEVNQGEGRTILFVSHNMTAISNLCKTGILLINGNINAHATIDRVINRYETLIYEAKKELKKNNKVYIKNAIITQISETTAGNKVGTILSLEFTVEQFEYDNVGIDILIKHENQYICFGSSAYYSDFRCGKGSHTLSCDIGPINFAVGSYDIDINVCVPMHSWIEENTSIISFEITRQMSTNFNFELKTNRLLGYIIPEQKWLKK